MLWKWLSETSFDFSRIGASTPMPSDVDPGRVGSLERLDGLRDITAYFVRLL